MRILHLGQVIPDARVEKCMISDLNRGDQPAVVVYKSGIFAFDQLAEVEQFEIKYPVSAQLGFIRRGVINKLSMILEEFDPDLIHAHDIVNASLIDEFDYPWIYNDHEGWSKQIQHFVPNKPSYTFGYWKRWLGIKLRQYLYKRWEPKLLDDRISLVISDNLAEIHREHTKQTFVINNFPMKSEVPTDISNERRPKTLAYIGKEASYFSLPFRDTRGFMEAILDAGMKYIVIGDDNLKSTENVESIGWVHHLEINKYLSDVEFGALAYKPHKFHHFADRIKSYNYAHSGLEIVAPYTFDLSHFLAYRTYRNYKELKQILQNPLEHSPGEIANHAKENFLWENQESKITEAVKLATE